MEQMASEQQYSGFSSWLLSSWRLSSVVWHLWFIPMSFPASLVYLPSTSIFFFLWLFPVLPAQPFFTAPHCRLSLASRCHLDILASSWWLQFGQDTLVFQVSLPSKRIVSTLELKILSFGFVHKEMWLDLQTLLRFENIYRAFLSRAITASSVPPKFETMLQR